MYRGVGAAIIGGTPGTVLYLTSYDYFKSSLPPSFPPFLIHLTSGLLAEAFACVIYVPVDVVKERCQVSTLHPSPPYSTSLGALTHIARNEGVRGVYRGYAATLLSFGPFSGLYFAMYEALKSAARPMYLKGGYGSSSSSSSSSSSDLHLPLAPTVATSVLAGLAAAWVTTPLDLAKLRMQVVRGATGGAHGVETEGKATSKLTPSSSSSSTAGKEALERYSTITSSLKTIVKEGGIKGLWRGATARCLFFAPATGVTMTTYDMFKSYLSG
ncbi:hypothetical protein TrCOL_g5981 [Triparma columacea]|uniref:Mitochondrial carrier protein n=1 Tax=Triparma columacea TaxID=722753 RepID=A0A9W7LG44_9STRA|nr:hypothetical protein TrCOL_g5981 [Triparma columacea]